MSGRKDIDPHMLTPEYWNGHSLRDNCDRPRSHSTFKTLRTISYAERVLSEFLMRSGDKVPIRELTEGQIFNAEEVPPGTILELTRESLLPAYYLPYHASRRWGVVGSYTSRGEPKRNIVTYNAVLIDTGTMRGLELPPGVWGISEPPKVEIGEVVHMRRTLQRTTGLTVYEMGKGVPQETRASNFWQKLGILFRNPHGRQI